MRDTAGKLPAIHIPGLKAEEAQSWFEDSETLKTVRKFIKLFRGVQLYSGNGHVQTNVVNGRCVHQDMSVRDYPERDKKLN